MSCEAGSAGASTSASTQVRDGVADTQMAALLEMWPRLTVDARAAVLAMVKAAVR